MRLVIEIDDLWIVSVNDLYRPVVSAPDKKGRRHGFLRTSNEAMEFQDLFDEKLKPYRDQVDEFIKKCRDEYKYLGFKLTLLIGMPKDSYFYKRKTDDLRPHDSSNYIKAPEDRLAVFLGIDDKYNIESKAVKYCTSHDQWRFYIILEPTDFMKYNDEYIKEVYLDGSK